MNLFFRFIPEIGHKTCCSITVLVALSFSNAACNLNRVRFQCWYWAHSGWIFSIYLATGYAHRMISLVSELPDNTIQNSSIVTSFDANSKLARVWKLTKSDFYWLFFYFLGESILRLVTQCQKIVLSNTVTESFLDCNKHFLCLKTTTGSTSLKVPKYGLLSELYSGHYWHRRTAFALITRCWYGVLHTVCMFWQHFNIQRYLFSNLWI